MDDQTMLAAVDDEAVEPDANDASPDSTTALDASAEAADAVEETPEEVAAREAAELAEKKEREAREAAERAAADEAAREERAQAAVEKLSKGAGWAAQAGVYYDASHGVVKATSVSAAKQAARPADEDAPTDEQTEDELVADLTDVARESDSLDDIQVSEADAGYIDPVVFGRMVAKVTEAVTRNPLQRELFYKVLSFCQESKPLREIEQMVMALPGFERTSANAYHFIAVMENAGGLERFELDDEGDVVDDARKAGLTEDEIDDLVAEYAFMTTPAGQAVVEQHTPRARIIELLGLVPERRDTYIELMEFLAEEPRTYNEVTQLLDGRDVLWHLDSKGNPELMQPSVFLDKLHDAAAIEWQQGWQLSEEGRAYLDELKSVQN
ncbi:MAG: hypothetical protein MR433_08070 [Coriobacteriaceae bacterium]|nr:hypothetical protein [Coriobacteriaceae bacterium]MDD7111560.1 hypothetical protein [Coriobacteriaceae bacterium]MDY5808839.1 hypothetical protein [Coriobacteriales bacterium]